jgi:hypothetical protein
MPGIPFMVTKAMEQRLLRLGYSEQEIRGMTPAKANQILKEFDNAAERPRTRR